MSNADMTRPDNMGADGSRGHTPGPWKALVDNDGDNLSVTALDGDVQVIGGCGCCGSPWTDSDSSEANARLIAAAPDLLEALEALFDRNSILAKTPSGRKALAAIAKAKGGAA